MGQGEAENDRAANIALLVVCALIVAANDFFWIMKAGWKCGDSCSYNPPEGWTAWTQDPDARQWYFLTWPAVLSLAVLVALLFAVYVRASALVIGLLAATTLLGGLVPWVVWLAVD